MKCDESSTITFNIRKTSSYTSKRIMSFNSLLFICTMAKIIEIPFLELLSKPHKLTAVTAYRDTLILTKFNIIYLAHLLYSYFIVITISYLAISHARTSDSKWQELCYSFHCMTSLAS